MTWRAVLIAAALVVSPCAHAQGLDAAGQFTRKLYAAYQHGEPDYPGKRQAWRNCWEMACAAARRAAADPGRGRLA